jgi:hypothetical protein
MSVAENVSGVSESLGLLPSTEDRKEADRRTLATFKALSVIHERL